MGHIGLDTRLDKQISSRGFAIVETDAVVSSSLTVSMFHTVGLAEKGYPEIVVFGLPECVATPLLDRCVNWVSSFGEIPVDVAIPDICIASLVFKKIPYYQAERLLGVANHRNGFPVQALQLIWPDSIGHFPWEDDFLPRLDGLQPACYLLH